MAKAGCLSQGYAKILDAVTRLNELHQVLKAYGTDRYVSFELGVVSSYQYYTGIIFAGYTFGSGEAILKGGRYDKLYSYFGKSAASIGFAVVVDTIMMVINWRQRLPGKISRLRYPVKASLSFTARNGCTKRLHMQAGCAKKALRQRLYV